MELFAENGYAATATREICERAGVTKPVLYYHFESKDQLYRKLIEEAHEEARQKLAAAAQKGKTAEERLVSFLEADFDLARKNSDLVRIILREVFAPRGGTPDIDCVRIRTSIVSGWPRDGLAWWKGSSRTVSASRKCGASHATQPSPSWACG